jgi:hypothetical protein
LARAEIRSRQQYLFDCVSRRAGVASWRAPPADPDPSKRKGRSLGLSLRGHLVDHARLFQLIHHSTHFVKEVDEARWRHRKMPDHDPVHVLPSKASNRLIVFPATSPSHGAKGRSVNLANRERPGLPGRFHDARVQLR